MLNATSFLSLLKKVFWCSFYISHFEIPILGSRSLLYESSQQKLGWQFTAGVLHLNILNSFLSFFLRLNHLKFVVLKFSYIFFCIYNFEISIFGSISLLYESGRQKLGWQFTAGVPFEWIFLKFFFEILVK